MNYLSKYLEDKRFIKWVFNPDAELAEWWQSFESNNPEEKDNILLARKILRKLHTTDKELSEDEKIILFSRILAQVESRENKHNYRHIGVALLKYAAVAVIFFAIGALLFYKTDGIPSQFKVTEISEPVNTEDARLIRSGGENILLTEDYSRIEHTDDGGVVINDHVIDSASAPEAGIPEMNQLVIPYGKTSEVILPDGTHVILNAGSRLIYPDHFVNKTREVFLVGEAFFDVSHDEKQPFVVQTTDIRVRVLGTQFNVSAYPTDDIIETVLSAGKVRLEQYNTNIFSKTMELTPGQLATFNKSDRTTLLESVDVENYILWKDNLLNFESTDLSRVVKKLERYYNIRFTYHDPFLGGIKITGKLDLSDSRDIVLKNIADAATVKITATENGYYEIGI